MAKRCTAAECFAVEWKNPGDGREALKSTTQELHAPIGEYEKLLEAHPDAMVIVSRLGKIVHINGQLERLFSYARKELVGRNLQILMPELFRARQKIYGISAENLKRIFEPFSPTKLLLKGTGLGPSITKKVIEEHGGSSASTARQEQA